MIILGISAYYHDSAAALLIDGQIVAAAQEERFSRIKHDNSFPSNACIFCLKSANIDISEVDEIVFYEKPFLKFERILETHIRIAPKGFLRFIKTIPVWLKDRINMRYLIKREIKRVFECKGVPVIHFIEHHLSHAASAYYASPFEDAVILVMDAVGEWATTSVLVGRNNDISIIKEQHYPNSLGLFYSAFTYFLGFSVNSDEYKVMGLASYGHKEDEQTLNFINIIEKELISIKNDGAIQLHEKYFTFSHSMRMVDDSVWQLLFGFTRRDPNSKITQTHCNLAYAAQHVLEKIVLKIAKSVSPLSENICIAGGIALNCTSNGRIVKEVNYKSFYVPCSPGDAGGAIGACLYQYYGGTGFPRKDNDVVFLGPYYEDQEIKEAISKTKLQYKHYPSSSALCIDVAELLDRQKIIGWFQGKMEFGPRALGNRSILADARNPLMKAKINAAIKFREAYRPFAPAIMSDYQQQYFDIKFESRYMMFACPVTTNQIRPHSIVPNIDNMDTEDNSYIPSVTHVDYSSRVQTVSHEINPLFYELLASFNYLTGCPILLNTSFNVMGEPIVCSPIDAINTFNKSGLDCLVIGNYIIEK